MHLLQIVLICVQRHLDKKRVSIHVWHYIVFVMFSSPERIVFDVSCFIPLML